MFIGQAYTDVLTPQEQQALQFSCEILIDDALSNIQNIKKPEDISNTNIGMYLPQRYLHKYTPAFFRKFTICIIIVTWKLAQPQHMPLSSLAEELAAWVIIQEAKRHLRDDPNEKVGNLKEEVENAFDTFIDIYFEDTDFEFLYDNSFDGIEETELSQIMDISSFSFKDWFSPFSNDPSRTPHPYILEDYPPETEKQN